MGMWPYFPELLAVPVPRYTSYPTAAEFQDGFGDADGVAALAKVQSPASLYIHIPYCEKICWYCGCNTGAAGRTSRLNAYLTALDAELELVAARLGAGGAPRDLSRISFGGGSPNAITPLAFVRLLDRIVTAFGSILPHISVELDPRGFTSHWAGMLGSIGVAQVSFGVQTLADHVQQRIGRVQPRATIEQGVEMLRAAAIPSINFDLMYGLPGQTTGDLIETLDAASQMRPERIALFGYAHVPDMFARQRRIDASDLPDAALRFEMAAMGSAFLLAAGYIEVGFDHFALPHDPLAKAAQSGQLRRNFQGFTDDSADVLIGVGASAISVFPDILLQNEKNAGRYRMRVTGGQLASTRGVRRDADDAIRAKIIEDILCLRPTDLSRLDGWQAAVDGLTAFVERAVARLDGAMLSPTRDSAPYARSMAVLFDRHRRASARQFSQAV